MHSRRATTASHVSKRPGHRDRSAQSFEVVTLERIDRVRVPIHRRVVPAAHRARHTKDHVAVLAEEIGPRAIPHGPVCGCDEGLEIAG
jgi:predicted dinucleotide-binding enzyme